MNKEELERNNIEMLIRDLKEHSLEYWASTQDEMVQALRHLQQENKQLQKQLKEKEEKIIIMEKYFELISDLGFDYDGFNTVENLKGLIDELVRYARLGRVFNTTEPIYESNGKKNNILGKDILDKEK